MKKILLFVAACLVAGTAAAQNPTPASHLTWDQGATDLATAQAYTYRHYPDAAVAGTTLTGVTCTGTVSPFVCTVNFPAFTPGAHTLTLTAANTAGESAKSAAFAFTFVVVPTVPGNLRITQAGELSLENAD